MSHKQFVNLILEYLGNDVIESEVYGTNEITLNMKNINAKKGGLYWDVALENYLKEHNIEIETKHGDNNWVTIYKK